MKLPEKILSKVFQNYQVNDFLLVEINPSGLILDYQGNKKTLPDVQTKVSIKQLIIGLETEVFDADFLIPFYHLNDEQVIDLHHYIVDQRHYLLLVPQNHVHKEVQQKQQIALTAQLQNQSLRTMLAALEQSQDQLKQANKDKSFLIAALSHEIGTPMNSIQGHAQMGLQDLGTAEKALQVILKSSLQVQQIISHTLKVNRDESRKDTVAFNLKELLKELQDSLLPLASFKTLTFNIDCPKDVTIYSQRAQWQQILTNLITNAIKYTQTGGIYINVNLEDPLLTVDICDTGIGISPEFQTKLFQSWQRENKSDAKGSGIGLVIAKMLAESIGLTLVLKSTSSEGSCFRVTYTQPQQTKKRVLLIEDDDDLRSLFAYYLQPLSSVLEQASSWQEVRTQFQDQQFDVILTDRHLADGKADEHLPHLRQLATKVLVMTGNPDKNQINALNDIGFDQVLSKPLTQAQLKQAVFNS